MHPLPPFYLNIVILNKKDVVASVVSSTTGIKKGILGKAMSFAANKVISEEKVTSKFADTLIEKFTSYTSDLGIKTVLTKVYQQDNFVVIKVQIREVDKISVLASKGHEFTGSLVDTLASMAALSLSVIIPTVDDKLMILLQQDMMRKFSDEFPGKVAEAGVLIDIEVRANTEQADYFYDFLNGTVPEETAGSAKESSK